MASPVQASRRGAVQAGPLRTASGWSGHPGLVAAYGLVGLLLLGYVGLLAAGQNGPVWSWLGNWGTDVGRLALGLATAALVGVVPDRRCL